MAVRQFNIKISVQTVLLALPLENLHFLNLFLFLFLLF